MRERLLPAETFHVTAIHKTRNPFFVTRGKFSISTDGTNWQYFEAPYSGVTEPGTQRLICVFTDTVWTTVHANPDEERDVKKLEDRLARTPDLPPALTGGIKQQLTII